MSNIMDIAGVIINLNYYQIVAVRESKSFFTRRKQLRIELEPIKCKGRSKFLVIEKYPEDWKEIFEAAIDDND